MILKNVATFVQADSHLLVQDEISLLDGILEEWDEKNLLIPMEHAMVRNHDRLQQYDIVHFEHKLSRFYFWFL